MIEVITRPTIVLKELSIDYDETLQDSGADEYAETLGLYPYLQIGNIVIQTNDTIKIILYNNHFLPKVEVHFKDPTFRLIDPLFPTDNEILSIFIQSNSEILMPVRMDFKIIEFNVNKNKSDDNQELTYVLIGILNVNPLYFTPFISYKGTSYTVLKKISIDCELGFASNINDTNDEMVWINGSSPTLEFVQEIVQYSYKSDESFMYAYVDFYYNLNYVDIETALNEDISEQTGVMASSNIIKGDNEPLSNLILTDHPDKSNSNLYINKYNLINSSTKVNLQIGYATFISYYDMNNNTFYKFKLETISTTSSNGNHIILKGNINELVDLNNITTRGIMGRLDTDNVHPNFLYAEQQNSKNLNFLQKVKIKISLKLMNFNLYRFQKIMIKFYKLSELHDDDKPVVVNEDTIKNPQNIDYDEKRLNQRLTGEWLITAINYNFNRIGGFSQDITLVKRELGFNDEDFNKI